VRSSFRFLGPATIASATSPLWTVPNKPPLHVNRRRFCFLNGSKRPRDRRTQEAVREGISAPLASGTSLAVSASLARRVSILPPGRQQNCGGHPANGLALGKQEIPRASAGAATHYTFTVLSPRRPLRRRVFLLKDDGITRLAMGVAGR